MEEQIQDAVGEVVRNTSTEVGFYIAVFVISAVMGVSRAIRDDDYRNALNCFVLGVCSGGLGFCVVALIRGPGHIPSDIGWFYLGLAALVGLGGKEGDKLVWFLWDKLFSTFGINPPPEENDTESSEH